MYTEPKLLVTCAKNLVTDLFALEEITCAPLLNLLECKGARSRHARVTDADLSLGTPQIH